MPDAQNLRPDQAAQRGGWILNLYRYSVNAIEFRGRDGFIRLEICIAAAK